ncbi:MAG: GNAT family N-acetyltransferase, partial [Desulfobacterales bacterium]|nr:GNAT family N-acetyltransferase [Desulfobacterales bacterium]
VKEAFDESVASDYTQEGVEEFYKYANKSSLAERSKADTFTIIAYQEQQAVGIIEIKEYCHISMFFVKPEYQKRGYGKALFNEALSIISAKKIDTGKLTVNSSLNAVPSYKRLGFKIKAKEQCYNGIRFIPMELIIKKFPGIP